MSNGRIGVADQEGESKARQLALAERELSAFVTAVQELFGAEQSWQAGNIWIEELERMDWPSEAPVTDWRKVTIAAARRLVDRDKRQLSRS